MSLTSRNRLSHVGGAAAVALATGWLAWAALQAQQVQGQRGAPPPAPAGAQQPARDNQNQPAVGTASLSGAVLLDGAGTPVRRAQVRLSGAGVRVSRSAITDDQGRFSFTALPAGRFMLSASKAGYVPITFGAKKPGRPGTPIDLVEGQKMDKVLLNLPKGSVITGVVVDDAGEPSPGTQVRVLRYVMQTGEKTLQQAGQDQTDDRGMYRIYGLQPGDYIVSAVPRNVNAGGIAQMIAGEVQALLQQAQAAGGGGGQAAGRGGGRAAGAVGTIVNGRGQQLLDQASALQQQLQQQNEQTTAYAPVYYPGTTTSGSAMTVTLGVGEERSGIDVQLQLVPTAKVEGHVTGPDGSAPPGTMVSLVPVGQPNVPGVPGIGANTARVDQTGRFSFQNVTPGQYTLSARAAIRRVDPNAPQDPQRGGRGALAAVLGGRGGPGQISQVLWASTDVGVSGQDVPDVGLNLQPGMTVSGRVQFSGTTLQPPADLTRVRVTLSPQGQQALEIPIGVPPATVDANGLFTLAGVPPGRYLLRANAPVGGDQQGPGGRGGGARGGGFGAGGATTNGGSWALKSAIVAGKDVLDFPLEIEPNQDASGAVLTFTDKSQQLAGTLQDASGRPTADYTIIVFPSDQRYWQPQSRRIASTRPGTDGTFTFRGLPPGDYRLTAVTDAEPGEWYDPNFLSQILPASIGFSLAEGEKKTQDIKLAGGG